MTVTDGGSALPLYRERGDDSASGKGGRPGVGPSDSQPAYISDADFTLYQGDALEVLREMPAASVHCCVTSPPYWGLRDYGHEGQLGLEQTPDEYVRCIVDVFREVRRVLRDDGTLWLNLGDSYASGEVGRVDAGRTSDPNCGRNEKWLDQPPRSERRIRQQTGLKPKDMIGIPWRVAFALQADGWYLRSDIIWHKPNPMPESVTDRPTKAHEYVFLLTKSPRYFYDGDAIREPATFYGPNGANGSRAESPHAGQMLSRSGNKNRKPNPAAVLGQGDTSHGIPWEGFDRNARTVWDIATQPYAEAHFATFPQELARRCIAAGTSDRGCCPECGAPWRRVIEGGEGTYAERKALGHDKAQNMVVGGHSGHHNGLHPEGMSHDLTPKARVTKGWSPTCEHFEFHHAPIPCTVLDPFLGSGTTAFVARGLGRRSVGIELNPEYAALCARRLQQQSLLTEGAA